jgi:hypothetical protein
VKQKHIFQAGLFVQLLHDIALAWGPEQAAEEAPHGWTGAQAHLLAGRPLPSLSGPGHQSRGFS